LLWDAKNFNCASADFASASCFFSGALPKWRHDA
jgi:hypothetical protein